MDKSINFRCLLLAAGIYLFCFDNSSFAQDSLYLRTLATTSLTEKDTAQYDQIAMKYIKVVKQPYVKDNLTLLMNLATKTTDRSYVFLMRNGDEILKENAIYVLERLKSKIYYEIVVPFNGLSKSDAEWLSFIEKNYVKFGEAGREISQRHYLTHLIDTKNWVLFSKKLMPYLDKNAKIIHPNDINSFAWKVFEKVDDPILLNKCIASMEPFVKKGTIPQYIDTYANLLYKTGKKNEAIFWEQEALKKAPSDSSIQEVLNKMKSNEKTW
jgi:hypothetical protein